jgi:hypothetical protein
MEGFVFIHEHLSHYFAMLCVHAAAASNAAKSGRLPLDLSHRPIRSSSNDVHPGSHQSMQSLQSETRVLPLLPT